MEHRLIAIKRSIGAGLFAVLVGLAAQGLAAAEAAATDLARATALVMVEDAGCPWCARFDAETRASYTNSPAARLAPLVRRPRGAPDIAFLDRIVYSPTFVLLVEGREAGRIVGYQGNDLFWLEMSDLLRRAGLESASSARPNG